MKPSELYQRKPEKIDNNINVLHGCYFNHVPEIELFSEPCYMEPIKNSRITIHYYKDWCYDGRRTWMLAAIKFDDKFVMIIQNAGREGDDHEARFITDKPLYDEMVSYIRTLVRPLIEDRSLGEVVDVDTDIKNLTKFYNGDLDGLFEHY